ncbi:hypothetical protein G6M89_09305 [Natronolimnobius sp. AArcel1]|uniref:hypothetical protein n=1 Tax=Natronolimnobius sp. AArcel1 TaxID=1679093 RepID=UPI0013EA56A4|nr:hypothetical protein [Natronolimnobius sp. AArcel1]NGM69201.1 hypothetical protein [Natronolimnobius sp. AArcel1]
MDNEFLAKTLKRIFDECQEAQNRGDAKSVGTTLVEEFNELLQDFKDKYPDNEVIQNVEPVGLHNWTGASAHPQDVQKVKQNCLKIADVLDLDTSDFREPSTSESFTTINFEANQRVEQSVSIDSTLEMVEKQMIPNSEREKLREAVEEFGKELDSDDPDKSRLEKCLSTAREYQPQIALQLGAVALNNGIDVLLGAK